LSEESSITGKHQYLLVCDLDGTLLGDDVALGRFSAWIAARRSEVALAYSSGRLHWSILEAMELYPLPRPDIVVGGVGTEVRFGSEGDPCPHWESRFCGWDASRVRNALRRCCGLRLQVGNVHSPYKVSYVRDDLTSAELEEIEATLRAAGLDVRLIYSTSRDLDVVPAAAGKGSAASYLAQRLGLTMSRVIACGDSGNDVCMLKQAGLGIVVGNAFSELAELSGPNIYRSRHYYADGVLDGLEHWSRSRKAA
jgi:sucrose-6F-phosphate phosphohydrolase